MDIVDAQLHIGPLGIESTVAAMDALGIRAALIDEYWMSRRPGDPGYVTAAGVLRPIQPTAELAAMLYPDRFSYLVRVERLDPEARAIVRMARDAPHARAIRITPGMAKTEASAFEQDGYDQLCAEICDCGLPLFVFAPTQAATIARLARKFPSLKITFDHCGLISNSMRSAIMGAATPHSTEDQALAFEEVLRLADLPNVALKWGHAPAMFEQRAYPGEGLWPMLRKAIGAFGSGRVMWASDVTANQTGETWAELLFGVLGMPGLLPEERNDVLGGAVRKWLDWPS